MAFNFTHLNIGQIEEILNKLQIQQNTVEEMLRANNALSTRFGEILTPSSQSSTTTLDSLLREQVLEIDNFRNINENLLDYFSQQLADLRLRCQPKPTKNFSKKGMSLNDSKKMNPSGSSSSSPSHVVLEGPRKVNQSYLIQSHQQDDHTPSFSDESNGTMSLSREMSTIQHSGVAPLSSNTGLKSTSSSSTQSSSALRPLDSTNTEVFNSTDPNVTGDLDQPWVLEHMYRTSTRQADANAPHSSNASFKSMSHSSTKSRPFHTSSKTASVMRSDPNNKAISSHSDSNSTNGCHGHGGSVIIFSPCCHNLISLTYNVP